MGRRVKDARLDNRTARLSLRVRSEPYWRLISEGCHIGYYRGMRVGKWVARYRQPGSSGGYAKVTLAEADDVRDSDGESILSFNEADAKARRWFEDISNLGGHRSRKTVSDALDAYIEGFTGKSLAKTKARIESAIRPALGHVKLCALTRKTVADWFKSRANSPAALRTKRGAPKRNERAATTDEAIRSRRATANRDLTVLKAALNRYSEEHPGLPVHAWRDLKPFKGVDTPKYRYLTDDEARRLTNACHSSFRPMMQAALLTGARYGDLTKLHVHDVDVQAGTVWLPEPKGGRPYVVYLDPEGRRLFESAVAGKSGDSFVFLRPDGERWRASQQQRYLQRACKNGNIQPRATFQDLRRTYGARLAMRGTPLSVVREAMGHADERITRRHYAHLAPSYVSDLVRQRAAGLGIVETDANVDPIASVRIRRRRN